MNAWSKLVAAASLFAMAVLLFVVVCPATPTPTALVVHSRTSGPLITVAAPLFAVLLSAVIFALMFVRAERVSKTAILLRRISVLDRTCVCLC